MDNDRFVGLGWFMVGFEVSGFRFNVSGLGSGLRG